MIKEITKIMREGGDDEEQRGRTEQLIVSEISDQEGIMVDGNDNKYK